MRRRHFTRTELMIVFATLGMLIAILFAGSLRSGAHRATAPRCAGPLGDVGRAWSAYAADEAAPVPNATTDARISPVIPAEEGDAP